MTPSQHAKVLEALDHFDAAMESSRLYGGTDAKRGFGVYSDQDSRFVRCMHESIAKHRRALESAIREALSIMRAEGVGKPVLYRYWNTVSRAWNYTEDSTVRNVQPLYAAPPIEPTEVKP